jgi:hypothetical protein
MNPKIEVIKGYIPGGQFELFRREMKRFAETHKVVNVSMTVTQEAETIFAAILYEEIDRQ